jgi:hypothetical protein
MNHVNKDQPYVLIRHIMLQRVVNSFACGDD